ncbi:unnamed protein product [Arctogadus glacialis]
MRRAASAQDIKHAPQASGVRKRSERRRPTRGKALQSDLGGLQNATASALAPALHRGSQGSVLPRPGPVAHCTTCSAWAFQLCMHRVAPRPMQQRRVPGGVRHYGGRPRHRPLLKN